MSPLKDLSQPRSELLGLKASRMDIRTVDMTNQCSTSFRVIKTVIHCGLRAKRDIQTVICCKSISQDLVVSVRSLSKGHLNFCTKEQLDLKAEASF